jgi:hypothetical protein
MILALTAHMALADVIQIEAEDATVDASNIIENEAASGGKVVAFAKDAKSTSVKFEFELKEDGTYSFWANAAALSGNQDSFFFNVDKEEKQIWDVKHNGQKLNIQQVRMRYKKDDGKESSKPFVLELTKGKHTLTVNRREPDAQLDKIIIADKDYKPDMKK